MKVYSFERLLVWQKARAFTVYLYKMTAEFPRNEQFGIIDQIRRAGASVPTNLAEGSSRTSKREQDYYCQISHGSLMEVLNHLLISHDLQYITKDQLQESRRMIDEISLMLTALRKSHLNS